VVVAVGAGSAAVEVGMVAAVVGAVITSVEAEGLGAGVGLEEGAGLDGVRLDDGVEIGVGVVV